ncbi:hypothetical protein [Actinoplanes solisilvae]|uniref:hypothetical protein n=1 Tax=Actinoplanes solisilvae TaxID=2486853 RepID=UPI000FD805D6|nr:hypothetical protein [Actinoplanes solisilvae]
MPTIDLDFHDRDGPSRIRPRISRLPLVFAVGVLVLSVPGEPAGPRAFCEPHAVAQAGTSPYSRQAVVVDVDSGAILRTVDCRPR